MKDFSSDLARLERQKSLARWAEKLAAANQAMSAATAHGKAAVDCLNAAAAIRQADADADAALARFADAAKHGRVTVAGVERPGHCLCGRKLIPLLTSMACPEGCK